MLGRVLRRLRALLFRGAADRELDAELRYHLEREVERNVADGMSREEARRAALRDFGGVEQARERCRDARGVRLVEELRQDLVYGVRVLRKNPGFTLVAVFTLALGVGATTAIFSVVNAVLLRPLPFENPDRLVVLWGTNAQAGADRIPISYLNFTDYKNQAQAFAHVAACDPSEAVLAGADGEPESLSGARVTAELFPLLGVRPALGRVFSAEEDRPGGAAVVVLSHGLWRRRFASDPRVVGRQITLDERATTVLGVMPPGFEFAPGGGRSDFWTPIASDPRAARLLSNRRGKFLTVVARLKPEVGLARAAAELEVVGRRLEAQYPEANTGWRARLVPLQDDLVSHVRRALLILLGAVALVLLIACANVANLLLARAASRGKEMAIRTALGASRWRVMRQLLTESLLLSLAGGGLGLLLAKWVVDAVVAAGPDDLLRLADVRLDSTVLGFTLAVSVLTGVVFGLAPAVQASKTNLSESLKEGGGGSTGGSRRGRLRGALVVSEVALSLVLLVGAGLLIKSFVRLLQTDPGYRTERVLTTGLSLPESKYPRPEQQADAYRQVLGRVRAVRGVETAGAASLLPLGGRDSYNVFRVEGRPPFEPGKEPSVRHQVVSPDYFRAMSIPLRRGRFFDEWDAKDSPPVVMVNEAFARRHLDGEEPLGKGLVIGDEPAREIVGVVENVRHRGLDEEPQPEFYVSYLQAPRRNLNLVVRAESDEAARVAASVREAVREVDRDVLVREFRTADALLSRSVAPRRLQMTLLGGFALAALVLAGVGIYGVIAYTVTQRTHEIGIRIALGARRGDVLRLVVGQGMTLALVGIGIGLPGAFAATRLMRALLYEVEAGDPSVFAGCAALLTFTALAACCLPAKRATEVDPTTALRHE